MLEIIQVVVSLYQLWHDLENDTGPSNPPVMTGNGLKGILKNGQGNIVVTMGADEKVVALLSRMKGDKEKDVGEKERDKERQRSKPGWSK